MTKDENVVDLELSYDFLVLNMITIVTWCGLLSFLYIPSSELFLKLFED